MAAQKKRRSSGTGSIFKDGRGYYMAQVLVGYHPDTGKPKYVSKRSKVERVVVDWLNVQTVRVSQGINLAPERVTVEAFLKRWLEGVERSNRYSTHKSYAQICRDHIIPRIGKILMSKLTLAQVQSVIDTMHDAGLARNTIRNCKACFVTATTDIALQFPSAYQAGSTRGKAAEGREKGTAALARAHARAGTAASYGCRARTSQSTLLDCTSARTQKE